MARIKGVNPITPGICTVSFISAPAANFSAISSFSSFGTAENSSLHGSSNDNNSLRENSIPP